MIPIISSEEDLSEQAQQLAFKWGFTFSNNAHTQYYLELTHKHLQLIQSGKNAPGPIFVDFSSGQTAHRRLFGGGKGQTIAKAVALNKTPSLVILDATAGLGKDAFVFASLGAQVTLMERSPIAAALLTDGLQRAALNKDIAEIIERMVFIYGDLRQLNTENKITFNSSPDVIYLDPMFPHRKKSALVKKEMLALQELIGDDLDSNELLSISKQIAKKRVVVKRPIKAPWLNDSKPSLTMKMKKHRFDIYLL